MEGLRKISDRVLEFTISVLISLLVVDVLWQVFLRFVLQDASSVTEELARFLLVWVGLLGASYGVSKKLHLGVDLLPRRLKGGSKIRLEVAIQCLTIVFAFLVLIVGGGRLVLISFHLHHVSAAMRIPLGVVYAVLPISGVLIVFYCVSAMRDRLS